MFYFIIFSLLILSGLFSGMVLGFYSLNKEDLKRKAKLDDLDAKRIYELREKGNLLLCTLLIGNVAVNATISIYLSSITYGALAGVIAIVLIVTFGEITPKAVFSHFAMALSARTVWLARIFLFILYPIAWPIAKLLDAILGREIIMQYSREELVQIIEDHHGKKEDAIAKDEKKVITGALTYAAKIVDDIYTPKKSVYMLRTEDKLTKKLLNELREKPFSRIPVYQDEHENVVGILYRTDLLGKDFLDKEVSDFMDERVIFIENSMQLDELLAKFKRSKLKLFMVRDKFKNTLGVVTMEDLVEEILKTEIVDEDDHRKDMRS